jgi:hypothetical protein
MRIFLVMTLFVAGFVVAGTAGYEERRVLDLPAGGLSGLSIHAGPGSLEVKGVAGADLVHVVAVIRVDERDAEQARKAIEAHTTLSLQRNGENAQLISGFADGFFGFGDSGTIELTVEVPEGMHLDIDDSSGAVVISGTRGNVTVDDSSGSMTISDVGAVDIEDSSGSVEISGATGDVVVDDGSGSKTIETVAGSVRVGDGSGSIQIDGVEGDVVVEESGSGGVTVDNVRGTVTTDE